MKILFILGKYPTLSEEFIYRDLQQLEKPGVKIYIYALNYSKKKNGARFTLLTPEISLAKHAREMFARPRKYFGTLSLIWRLGKLSFRETYARGKMFLKTPVLAELCRKHEVEHIHAHFAYLPADAARMLSEFTALAYGVSVHGWDLYTQEKYLVPRVVRAKNIVCCTQYYAARIQRILRGKGLHIPLWQIYHGLPVREIHWEMAGETQMPYSIVAAGRFIPKKGFEVLIRACGILLQCGVDIRLTLCGDGSLKKYYLKTAQANGLSDKIRLTGWLPPEAVRQEMAKNQVYVQPSLLARNGDCDGIPNTLLEALALGVPCVASNIAGIPEAIEHRVTGLLVQPGNAAALAENIQCLCQDIPLRQQVSKQGRGKMELLFNGQENARRFYALLESLCAETRAEGKP